MSAALETPSLPQTHTHTYAMRCCYVWRWCSRTNKYRICMYVCGMNRVFKRNGGENNKSGEEEKHPLKLQFSSASDQITPNGRSTKNNDSTKRRNVKRIRYTHIFGPHNRNWRIQKTLCYNISAPPIWIRNYILFYRPAESVVSRHFQPAKYTYHFSSLVGIKSETETLCGCDCEYLSIFSVSFLPLGYLMMGT